LDFCEWVVKGIVFKELREKKSNLKNHIAERGLNITNVDALINHSSLNNLSELIYLNIQRKW
jgi:hypothetical protein